MVHGSPLSRRHEGSYKLSHIIEITIGRVALERLNAGDTGLIERSRGL
jgi:hypothetical protein